VSVPHPTPIFRIVHVDCLRTLLQRGGLRAANHTPNDGLPYRTIHNVDIQGQRHIRNIPCGPRGTLHDYVPFYFAFLSPMLLQLKTGRVAGYNEGQAEFLIYQSCPWELIQEIGVLNTRMKTRVEAILNEFDAGHRPVVNVCAGWYY
jgi:hypothetical protein